jgi:hypothetical protein
MLFLRLLFVLPEEANLPPKMRECLVLDRRRHRSQRNIERILSPISLVQDRVVLFDVAAEIRVRQARNHFTPPSSLAISLSHFLLSENSNYAPSIGERNARQPGNRLFRLLHLLE